MLRPEELEAAENLVQLFSTSRNITFRKGDDPPDLLLDIDGLVVSVEVTQLLPERSSDIFAALNRVRSGRLDLFEAAMGRAAKPVTLADSDICRMAISDAIERKSKKCSGIDKPIWLVLINRFPNIDTQQFVSAAHEIEPTNIFESVYIFSSRSQIEKLRFATQTGTAS